MLSSSVRGGSIPGNLRASIVFPDPGGPLRITLLLNATHLRLCFRVTVGEEPVIEVTLV
jgi:hypothetical protein